MKKENVYTSENLIKGQIIELKVQEELLRYGFDISIPTYNSSKYDLIADTEINLAIKECANDLSDNDKRILAFLINQNEAKIDFAKRIGISRPTLDKKINLIRQMLKEKIYVA